MLVAGKSEGVPAKQVFFGVLYTGMHFNVLDCGTTRQEKPWSDCLGQVKFALGQVDMEVLVIRWASESSLSSLVC